MIKKTFYLVITSPIVLVGFICYLVMTSFRVGLGIGVILINWIDY